MHPSHRLAILAALAIACSGISCKSEQASTAANAAPLDRAALLGVAEGWGLLGLPFGGGPLSYRRAEDLVSPTWAPPELGEIGGAWPGDDAIWIQFRDTRIGLYDYPTGHLLNFDSLGAEVETAVALPDGSGLVVARDTRVVELVAESQAWQAVLDGSLSRMVGAGGRWIVAVVEGEPQSELVVLEPAEPDPLAHKQVTGVRDIVITPWGGQLYYLSDDDADTVVHGLSLPELGETEELPLPSAGRAIAVTPSAHRLYVAVGNGLLVFDRLRGQLVREIPLPRSASALRFSENGANLLARLDGDEGIAVLQVGVDSLLGVIPGEWDENLPIAIPGGRLVAKLSQEIVLYDLPRLLEIGRASAESAHVWLAVKWQPPQPRMELTTRQAQAVEVVETEAVGESAAESPDAEFGARPGHYAVVSAARRPEGVQNLAGWLRSVGYPGVVDRHRDIMGVIWFRAMVGPYPSRGGAEATAQELGARYGYKPWILNVEQSTEPADLPGDESDVPADTAAGAPLADL